MNVYYKISPQGKTKVGDLEILGLIKRARQLSSAIAEFTDCVLMEVHKSKEKFSLDFFSRRGTVEIEPVTKDFFLAKKYESTNMTNDNFEQMLVNAGDKTVDYLVQLGQFWSWLSERSGYRHEYTYMDFGGEVTDTFKFTRITKASDGRLWIHGRFDCQATEWKSLFFDSNIFAHYKLMKEKEGTWIEN